MNVLGIKLGIQETVVIILELYMIVINRWFKDLI